MRLFVFVLLLCFLSFSSACNRFTSCRECVQNSCLFGRNLAGESKCGQTTSDVRLPGVTIVVSSLSACSTTFGNVDTNSGTNTNSNDESTNTPSTTTNSNTNNSPPSTTSAGNSSTNNNQSPTTSQPSAIPVPRPNPATPTTPPNTPPSETPAPSSAEIGSSSNTEANISPNPAVGAQESKPPGFNSNAEGSENMSTSEEAVNRTLPQGGFGIEATIGIVLGNVVVMALITLLVVKAYVRHQDKQRRIILGFTGGKQESRTPYLDSISIMSSGSSEYSSDSVANTTMLSNNAKFDQTAFSITSEDVLNSRNTTGTTITQASTANNKYNSKRVKSSLRGSDVTSTGTIESRDLNSFISLPDSAYTGTSSPTSSITSDDSLDFY